MESGDTGSKSGFALVCFMTEGEFGVVFQRSLHTKGCPFGLWAWDLGSTTAF